MAEDKKELRIVYIGNDLKYWATVEYRFKSYYPEQAWLFENYSAPLKTDLEGQQLYCELLKKDPYVVYLDLTKFSEGKVFLSELNDRDRYNTITMVGLTSTKEEAREALKQGFDFVFIKCAELHDVVYGPLYLALPKVAKKTKFAEGKITKKCELIETCRIGYITPLSIHLESDYALQEGTTVALESEIPAKNIPSKWYEVKNKETSNLFYNKEYSYDLNFTFVDKPNLEDDSNVAPEEERIADYQERMKISRKKHKEWVITSIDAVSEKKTKVMTIDKSLRVLCNSSSVGIDKHPYAFRNYSVLDNEMQEIERIKPAIIAIQLFSHLPQEKDKAFEMAIKLKEQQTHGDEDDSSDGNIFNRTPEEKEAIEILNNLQEMENEELTYLKKVINKVKSFSDYQPYIILFRCTFQETEKLKQTFQYPHLIANKTSISLNIILNMAKIYEEKQNVIREEVLKKKVETLRKQDATKYRTLSINDLVDKRYHLKKKNPLSFARLKADINLVTLSESEITFSINQRLPLKSFEINYPFPLFIRLIPYEQKANYIQESGGFVFRALIQAIDEKDKKMLRRLVNDVFFEPINEKRAQEDSEYWEKHNKVLEERMKAIEEELKEEEKS